MTGRFC